MGGAKKTTSENAGKKKVASKKRVTSRLVSQGTIRSDFKSLRSAINWAMKRNPPLLSECPFTIPKIAATTVKPFLPTEEINRLIDSITKAEQNSLHARWLLDRNSSAICNGGVV